jgi:hypothetical protein
MGVDVKQMELDRITNMLRSFGWRVVSTRIEGEKLVVQMEKEVKVEVPKR